MSSIAQSFNGKTPYNRLNLISPKELKESKNVVLFIIDGLGYNYLISQNQRWKKRPSYWASWWFE